LLPEELEIRRLLPDRTERALAPPSLSLIVSGDRRSRRVVCSASSAFVGLVSVPDYNLSYIYVLTFFVVAGAFVFILLTLSRLIAPRKPTTEKLRTYESGEEPVGQAWGRYPTHFYVFALLFVVFDVEVIFLFPWAVLFRSLGWYGLVEMAIFIGILVVGLVYAWRKRALNWY
jgi:NADH-quinone oxidoreductase subunit A